MSINTVKKLSRKEFASLIEYYVLDGYDISDYLFRPATYFNHDHLRRELDNYILLNSDSNVYN